MREALDACLTPERYVIYPLGFSEIQQSFPWQDNCRLLLVPPTSSIATEHAQSSNGDTGMQHYQDETMAPCIPDDILQEIASFVSKGGVLLSMNSELNRMLGFNGNVLPVKYYQHGVCSVAPDESSEMDKSGFKLEKFNALHISALAKGVSQSSSSEVLQLEATKKKDLAIFTPVESDAALEWLDDADTKNQSNTPQSSSHEPPLSHLEEEGMGDVVATLEDGDLVCVRELELGGGGRAVASSVNLFPTVPQDNNSSSTTAESSNSCSLPPLSEEQVLAYTLDSLEAFLDTYQKTEMEELEQLYYKYR